MTAAAKGGPDPIERSHATSNREGLERLSALVARLIDGDLERPLDGGGTVSALLAHLAFWDRTYLKDVESGSQGMDNQLVKNGYDEAAEDYLRSRDQFKSGKYLDRLASLLKPQATVLDLGCGAGKPVDEHLVSKGFEVIGLDISEKQIELARRNVPGAAFATRDIALLTEGEYAVDAVVSFYAIFHTPRESHPELFRKINSFLPPGGWLLVTMGSSDWEGTQDDFHGVRMCWSHYGAGKNREIIEKAGFEVLLDEIDAGAGEEHQVVIARKL